MYCIGIVAVACVHNYDCDERIELYSKLLLEHSLILIWSFVDPIHPQVQYILYTYLCVCTYVYVLCVCVYIHVLYVCTCVYVCRRMFVCVCTCVHCVHLYVCRYYKELISAAKLEVTPISS